MSTPAQPVAACIARFLYEQASAPLKSLKSFIEQQLVFIDAQILLVRAKVAEIEPAKFAAEFGWNTVEAVIEKQKSNLLSNIPGPAAELCPEFYTYITAPAVFLLEASLAAFLPYKAKYQKFAYASAQLDELLLYWEDTKAQITAIQDVIDDALYNALILEAANAVP